MFRRLASTIPLALVVVCLQACGAEREPLSECIPQCGPGVCGDDGCGGSCGPCADTVDPDICDETCEGKTCGSACGVSCGTCNDDERCIDQQCVCAPKCSVATCGAADGCGGTCEACPVDVSCSECPLSLTVVQREGDTDTVRLVTVALDFNPKPGAPLPGIADLRFQVAGDAELIEVALGQALITAKKDLGTDPETGRPFRVMSEESGAALEQVIQILALSTSNQEPIGGGRLLFLKFRLGSFESAQTETPTALRLSLVARESIFAPPPADQAIWGATLNQPVIVWSDEAADVEVDHAP